MTFKCAVAECLRDRLPHYSMCLDHVRALLDSRVRPPEPAVEVRRLARS